MICPVLYMSCEVRQKDLAGLPCSAHMETEHCSTLLGSPGAHPAGPHQ